MMKGVFVMVIKIWDSLIDCGYFINFFMNWNYGVVILIKRCLSFNYLMMCGKKFLLLVFFLF